MEKEKSKDRLAILAKIDEFERKGMWQTDPEDDPPTIPLKPGQVDYTNKNPINKFLAWFITLKAKKFIKMLIDNKQMILKEPVGLENYLAVKDSGLIITCNHFNPFDNFCVFKALEKDLPHHILWRVIREGNYTSFPGFYGMLMRHCNCLPLSQNFSVMKEFLAAVKVLLKRGEKILVYVEQAMWWNYRKPRPLTTGGFKFAADSNVPVLPCFITMNDSDIIGDDGFPVQEYTLHILPAIFPDPAKTPKQNAIEMRDKNYQAWVETYEKVYGKKLEYLK